MESITKEKAAEARGMIQELYAIQDEEGELSTDQQMALELLEWLFQDAKKPSIE